MSEMRQRTIIALLTLLILVVCVALLWTGIVKAQTIPVLQNPNFEDGFTTRNAPEVEIAIGWDYAYLPGDDRECRAPCYRPEFKPEQEIVYQGQYSQRWFTTFARHFAAIHQEVSAEPGQWYEFTCHVQARTGTPPGDIGIFVGINPWGGDVFHRTMLWGEEQVGEHGWIYNEWVPVSVTAQAFGDRIRVAIGSNPQWATRNNTVYVDACTIRRVEMDGTPAPTYTPYPTYTPQPTPTPCPTCTPGGDCATVEQIMTVVADREPVKWPR